MKAPRDSQRQKIYDSEPSHKRGKRFRNIHEIQEFVDFIIASVWYSKYKIPVMGWRYNSFGMDVCVDNIEVRDGRGRRRATGFRTEYKKGVIKLPRQFRNMLIILHEIAHVIQTQLPYHGPQFARIYLDLAQAFAEKKVAGNLENAFKRNRVKYD